MTIKQQGGIFGRNPTFNDVDVEGTLTVNGEPISDFGTMAQQDADAVVITGGSGAFDTLSVDTNNLYVDTVNNRVGMGTTSPAFELHLARNGAGIFVQSTNSVPPEVRLDSTIRSWTQYVDSDGTYNFRDRTGSKTVLQFTTAGNLAVANGNGIDFSATSGTGTSELFDDYEEGTFTPTLEASGGGAPSSYSVRAGSYTKIGNTVYIMISLAVNAGTLSGNIEVTGMPFSSSEASSIYTAAYRRWNTTFVSYGLINSGTSTVRIIKSTNNAISETAVTNTDMLSTDNRNSLIISGCYRTT
jgi:hypothetical protein